MNARMFPIALLILATPVAAEEEKAVPQDGQRTNTVEVVPGDTGDRMVRVRSDASGSVLRVDDRALDGIQGVKPGDKITITLRDEATGRRQLVTAVVNGTMSGTPPAAGTDEKTSVAVRGGGTSFSGERTVVLQQAGTPVELLSLDPEAKRIVVIGEGGAKQVLVLDDKTLLSLGDVQPGQKLFVSYRFDRNGKPEAVVRTAASAVTTTTTTKTTGRMKTTGGAVEIIAADPATKALTIRTDAGQPRTLTVDDMALVDLQGLKAGDTALLKIEGDRVLVITRRD